LLVVIAIIAILIGLLLPAVQKVREAAARMQCQNNMKQLAIAAHSYHDVTQRFPSYYNTVGTSTTRTWGAALLPYIEQENFQRAGGSAGVAVKTFLCPSNPGNGLYSGTAYPIKYTLTNYVAIAGERYADYTTGGDTGILGVFIGNGRNGVRMTDITDGTSNTIMIGERPSMPSEEFGWVDSLIYIPDYDSIMWSRVQTAAQDFPVIPTSNGVRFTSGSPCPFPMGYQAGNIRETCDTNHMWSQHTGGANFALGDGSIRFIPYTVGSTVLGQISTRARGEVVSNF